MDRFQGMSDADKLNDIQILNGALFFENRGVWAYNFAAGKLSTSEVGKTAQIMRNIRKCSEMQFVNWVVLPFKWRRTMTFPVTLTRVKVMSIVTSTSLNSPWRLRSAPL